MNTSRDDSNKSDDILVSSRSFAEYVAFFDLDAQALPDRILDCSSGASSFVAEAHARGVDAVAVDPVYALSPESLDARANAGVPSGNSMIDANSDRFVFDWYQTPQRRAEMRRAALVTFREHHHNYPEQYVAASLPELPFAHRAFDLALCSHLLFTWATQLDEQWHFAALVELCRIAEEVRVFPLVLQGIGESVEFLPSLRTRLHNERDITSDVVSVPYEFQVGARYMLKLRG
ncbi:MAG: hypothetical protein Q8M73_00200 [Actinomycetota bacterium]|nr:hypothetical protein [Actinomycetota bacterium]